MDIEITYMKIFRFLADILSRTEFDALSYHHVSKFISIILAIGTTSDEESQKPKFFENEPPMSLKKFICNALDLNLESSQESQPYMTI